MKFLKDWLIAEPAKEDTGPKVIDKVAEHLQGAEQPELLAAFSFILGRVCYADQNFCDQEIEVMNKVLTDKSHLNSQEVASVVSIVRELNLEEGATENYLVTRFFKQNATTEQKTDLLDCLFLISAADDSISGVEEKEIKLIAEEIGLSDHNFLTMRSKYREYREVLKGLRE